MADLVGRRLGGRLPLPWNRHKVRAACVHAAGPSPGAPGQGSRPCLQSWPGSAAFVVCGTLAALCYLQHFRKYQLAARPSAAAVALVAAASGVVESLPITEWDNLTVGCCAMGLSALLLQ